MLDGANCEAGRMVPHGLQWNMRGIARGDIDGDTVTELKAA